MSHFTTTKIQDATSKSVVDLTTEIGLTWLLDKFEARGGRVRDWATNDVKEQADPVEGTDHLAMATEVLPTKTHDRSITPSN